MHSILYQPGAAGDMVAAVIDSTDYKLIPGRIVPSVTREKVTPKDYTDIDRQIELWSSKYSAIATQYYEYYRDRKVDYILIDTSYDVRVVEWCLRRAEKVSWPHHVFSYNEVPFNYACISKAREYTDKIIDFRDILNGNLLSILKQWVDTPLNEDLYHKWLDTALTYFPFDISSYDTQNTIDHLHLS
jgi:hypothetical protein